MLDPRLLRIGIEVDGNIKWYEDLQIQASGTKYANAKFNECEVKITNLDKKTRDYLLTETSPFTKAKVPKEGEKTEAGATAAKDQKPKDGEIAPAVLSGKYLYIQAGRQSYGYSNLYIGEITSATIALPPDIVLTIKSMTGYMKKGWVLAKSFPTALLSTIAAEVASDLGYTLIFEAQDKQISNYTFTGGAMEQVEQLGKMGRVNAYVDDTNLVIKDYDTALKGNAKLLNMDTGLIGIPEITEFGVKVKYLFDTDTVLGGLLKVESKLNPIVNGVYTIYKLQFDLSNRDDQFYWIVEARRQK